MGFLQSSIRYFFLQTQTKASKSSAFNLILYLNNREMSCTSALEPYYYNKGNEVCGRFNCNELDTIILTKRILNLSQRKQIDKAQEIFYSMSCKDTVAWNTMIRGYLENDMVYHARKVFDEMPERNNVSWNSMIIGYCKAIKTHISLKLFICMPGKDPFSWTSMITGLCMVSSIDDAWRLFTEMPDPNAVTWAAIMSGFQQNGRPAEALNMFKDMLSAGVCPTSHSFTTALTASADLAMLSMSNQLYLQILKRGHEKNSHIGNSSVSMFMKCGSLADAKRVFDGLPYRNLVSLNCMITGYAQQGNGLSAITTFHQMLKGHVIPDRISFLGVLQGCSHCGLVKAGKEYFQSMERDYGINPGPEHYAILTDLFARAGLFEEAYQLVMGMPFEPTPVFWRSILNGCRIWRRPEMGIYAADQLSVVETSESNISSSSIFDVYDCRKLDSVAFLTRHTRKLVSRNQMGCSWVEIRGRTYLFTSRDETHLETNDIYKIIHLFIHDCLEHFRGIVEGPMYCEP